MGVIYSSVLALCCGIRTDWYGWNEVVPHFWCPPHLLFVPPCGMRCRTSLTQALLNELVCIVLPIHAPSKDGTTHSILPATACKRAWMIVRKHKTRPWVFHCLPTECFSRGMYNIPPYSGQCHPAGHSSWLPPLLGSNTSTFASQGNHGVLLHLQWWDIAIRRKLYLPHLLSRIFFCYHRVYFKYIPGMIVQVQQ